MSGEINRGRFGRRVVEADFSGGAQCSEGGVLLLRHMDRRRGRTVAPAAALDAGRQTGRALSSLIGMGAQRVEGLCLGRADVCDHNVLRGDLAMRTAVGRVQVLASAPDAQPTGDCGATPAQACVLRRAQFEQFIAWRRGKRPLRELVLDVDGTHMPLQGEQERSFVHGWYENDCYRRMHVVGVTWVEDTSAKMHMKFSTTYKADIICGRPSNAPK